MTENQSIDVRNVRCIAIILFYVWLMITAMINTSWWRLIYSISMPRVSFAHAFTFRSSFYSVFSIQIHRHVLHATICLNYTNGRVLLLFFWNIWKCRCESNIITVYVSNGKKLPLSLSAASDTHTIDRKSFVFIAHQFVYNLYTADRIFHDFEGSLKRIREIQLSL